MIRDIGDVIDIILGVWLIILLILTAPLWGLPYILWSRWRMRDG